MPAHAKKTPRLVAKIAEMRRSGKSLRAIAKETKLSDVTVSKWLEEAGVDGAVAKLPRSERRSKAAEEARDAITHALRVAASDSEGREGLATVKARLAMFTALVTKLAPLVLAGEINPQALATISNLEIRYANELASLELAARPPAQMAHESEADTRKAADEVRRMIAARVARLEAKRRCLTCGAHPDHPPSK